MTPSSPAPQSSTPDSSTSESPEPQSSKSPTAESSSGDDKNIPDDFRAFIDFVEAKGQPRLAADLYTNVSVVNYNPPTAKLYLHPSASDTLIKQLRGYITTWFGDDWVIQSMPGADTPPLAEQDKSAKQARLEEIKSLPPVKNILDIFPDATILNVEMSEQEN